MLARLHRDVPGMTRNAGDITIRRHPVCRRYWRELCHALLAVVRLILVFACLQRDVPGMTRNAIPVLVDEGVQAITIGVNGGSAPPGVPKNVPFIWRDNPSGKEIVTVVHPGMPSCCAPARS